MSTTKILSDRRKWEVGRSVVHHLARGFDPHRAFREVMIRHGMMSKREVAASACAAADNRLTEGHRIAAIRLWQKAHATRKPWGWHEMVQKSHGEIAEVIHRHHVDPDPTPMQYPATEDQP